MGGWFGSMFTPWTPENFTTATVVGGFETADLEGDFATATVRGGFET